MMKKKGVTIALFSAVFIAVSLNWANAAIAPAVLIDLVNQDRQSVNVSDLTVNPLLAKAAQMKADDMALKSYFSHASLEGIPFWQWIADAGYKFVYAGENLGMNYYNSQELEKAWMDSPKHRENILNPYFTEVGIAQSKGLYQGQEVTFVVQMFGSPILTADVAAITDIVPEINEDHYIFIGLARFNMQLAI